MIDVSVVRVHQHGACVAQNERRAANRTKTTDQQDKAESASGPNAKSSMALGYSAYRSRTEATGFALLPISASRFACLITGMPSMLRRGHPYKEVA